MFLPFWVPTNLSHPCPRRKLNARPIVHANARTPRRPTVKRATGLLGVLREILVPWPSRCAGRQRKKARAKEKETGRTGRVAGGINIKIQKQDEMSDF